MEAGGLYKNTANTNIVRHAGRHLALMEGVEPTEITASSGHGRGVRLRRPRSRGP